MSLPLISKKYTAMQVKDSLNFKCLNKVVCKKLHSNLHSLPNLNNRKTLHKKQGRLFQAVTMPHQLAFIKQYNII
jgi:hypothetical protein